MKHYLIQPSKGIIIGAASHRERGWSFAPFTSAHGGSRKAHMTKEAAALRYSGPSCRWIEGETINVAVEQVKALKAAYDAWEPCSKCALAAKTGSAAHPYHCCAGAAPDFSRNLGKCAKFMSEKQAVDQDEKAMVACPVSEDEVTGEVDLDEPISSSGEKPKAGHSPGCASGVKSGAPNKADAGHSISCRRHPEVILPTRHSCCPKCEADIDSMVMHTINDKQI